MMLQKLENQPVMPVMEMQSLYPDNWFRYVVGSDGQPRVLYVASSRDDLLTVSASEMNEAGYMEWGDVEGENLISDELIEIGGLEFAWSVND